MERRFWLEGRLTGDQEDCGQLKEILTKAKKEANSRELRVDISYMPGASGTSTTKVHLVGYSENVAKLNEVVHDFQLNQVATQETINLLQPEMVDCFDKILDLIGVKQTKVALQASHFPNPCVFVSGPRCHVQEAKEALTSSLSSLIVDTLTLDGPGAQQYFQKEGKVTKELIESSCHVLIRDKQTAATPNVQRPRNTSRLRSLIYNSSMYSTVGKSAVNKTNLKIKLSSLENEQVDVLVVPMLNKQLTSTNIGKSLSAKAGNALKLKFDSVVASCAIAPGDVQMVDAPPSLGCSKIFFIECLPWDGVRGKSVQALGNGLKKCLELCAQLNVDSVAIPIIGPGIVLKYPLREAIQVLTDVIHQFGFSASSGSLTNIHIVIKPGYPDSEECYHDVYKQLSLNMNQGGQAIFRSLTSDLDDIIITVGSGVKLHVVFGDITNETTDAVVNTTNFQNFDLDGICKDILTVAGPEVEAELKAANVNRGEVYVTQSGNFPCKAIFHVHGKQDEVLIEQLVCDIIDYCELYKYTSVAIPAICAGAGGLDPAIVAGAILQGIKSSASSMNSLTVIRLVLIKINAFLAFKEEVTPRSLIYSNMYSTVGNSTVNRTNLKIKLSSLENEQADVLVVPMLNKQLTSTNIGKSLLAKAGNTLQLKFDSVLGSCALTPGDVQLVDAPPSLGCSKIFFIECLPWDGVRGKSVQALGNSLKRCLELCAQLNLDSVAIPIIGPGIVLKYPLREAIQVLTDIIHQFGFSASSGSLTNIHIVIKPGYPDSEACYHDVYKQLSLNMNQGGQAIFRSLTSDLDDIILTVGSRVKLHVVFGDITNETTDAVVNTTNFQNFNLDGVCKDILTVAGPEVEAELKAANVNRGEVYVTQSGNFPCKAIFHVHGKQDEVLTEQLVCDIIDYCELYKYSSVAIPAICAGAGGLDRAVVAGAILQGIKSSTSSMNSLTDIRLVLIKTDAFLAFKEEAMQMYSPTVINKVLPGIPVFPVQLQQQQPPPSGSSFHIRPTSQQSVFTFLGLSKKGVDNAMEKLRHQYQTQCSSFFFSREELEFLSQDDMMELKELVEAEGLFMETDKSGTLTVSGLKDGVIRVMNKMSQCQHKNFTREVRVREEEDLYLRVVWCILANNGNWERLPRTANHQLENNKLTNGITDAQGLVWAVNLQRMVAKHPLNRQTTKLKRLENLTDFTFPLYWDSMAGSENMTVIPLESSSAEYRTVKKAFKHTVAKTVMKIDRLQNVHLRRAYEAQKKHISDKNAREGGAGEKLLYHGTTQENCSSIMKTGFNRRFAGQNATSFGLGTYFAVNANYSAKPTYSKPAADGSQLMFVARVLTGVYTQGQSDMKVPPPRNPQQPHDRYDSVVDRIYRPKIYVVFHDNQAYPDYLITFKGE